MTPCFFSLGDQFGPFVSYIFNKCIFGLVGYFLIFFFLTCDHLGLGAFFSSFFFSVYFWLFAIGNYFYFRYPIVWYCLLRKMNSPHLRCIFVFVSWWAILWINIYLGLWVNFFFLHAIIWACVCFFSIIFILYGFGFFVMGDYLGFRGSF